MHRALQTLSRYLPADIGPFISMGIVIQLAMSPLSCYSFSLLSSQSSPRNLFQSRLSPVSQLQPNSSRCLGPKSRIILESSLSLAFPHSILWQILSTVLQNIAKSNSHFLHCFHLGPNYHPLLSGLLQ